MGFKTMNAAFKRFGFWNKLRNRARANSSRLPAERAIAIGKTLWGYQRVSRLRGWEDTASSSIQGDMSVRRGPFRR
jgi:hypothetical protein